ncbi:MAG TPA: TlpA disulfide reductase family protein [Tepidisphaeraceae bacterium]|nr:TlpA disulfide reductase family protein [Tepidisphaeraceae bacterium]
MKPIFAIFALLLAACASTQLVAGQPAPDFSLAEINGGQLSLSQFKGKVVVLDFWATWCPDCRQSLPHLQALANKGIQVLAVDEGEDSSTIRSFLNQNHYTFTVVQDTNGSVLASYGLHDIPTTIIIGRDGDVRNIIPWTGPQSSDDIDAAVRQARQ